LDVFRTPFAEERDLMRKCQELWSLNSRKITNAYREKGIPYGLLMDTIRADLNSTALEWERKMKSVSLRGYHIVRAANEVTCELVE
jgi:hypothetical protein